jgi:uncharacterized membrane protein
MENNTSLPRKIAIVIYILYLAAILMPPLAIVGIVFAYIFENDATDMLVSHYTYLIRTFWIGLLFFAISGVLIPVVIGILLMLLSTLWWLIRVVKGLKDVLQFKEVRRPRGWTF